MRFLTVPVCIFDILNTLFLDTSPLSFLSTDNYNEFDLHLQMAHIGLGHRSCKLSFMLQKCFINLVHLFVGNHAEFLDRNCITLKGLNPGVISKVGRV